MAENTLLYFIMLPLGLEEPFEIFLPLYSYFAFQTKYDITGFATWQAVYLFPQRLETAVPGVAGNRSFCLLG
jgi:hypothetical protein